MSFAIALSGLNAASADLSTTANNIANANTTGFKYSRAQFGDVYSAASSGISSNNTIGSGVRVEQISQQFGQGTINFTNSSLELAISGSGFFTVSNNGALQYTRNGAFGTDAQGYLVNQAGDRMQPEMDGDGRQDPVPACQRQAAKGAHGIGQGPQAGLFAVGKRHQHRADEEGRIRRQVPHAAT